MGFLRYFAAAVSIPSLLGFPVQAQCPDQDVSDERGVGSFSSISDGQPPAPDQPQLQSVVAYDNTANQTGIQFGAAIVPSRSGFLCQSQFAISSPTYLTGDGSNEFDNVVGLAWEQRWYSAGLNAATLSTQISVSIPYGRAAGGSQVTSTLIATRPFGSGVVYGNLSVQTEDSVAFRNPALSAIAGYKHILREGREVIVAAILEERGGYGLETAIEIDLTDGVSIGPGINWSRSSDGTANWTIGVALSRGF